MDEDMYDKAIKIVDACHKKNFVGFLSKEQSEAVSCQAAQRPAGADPEDPPADRHAHDEHPQADADAPTGGVGQDGDKPSRSK
jgi:hypothetical protein